MLQRIMRIVVSAALFIQTGCAGRVPVDVYPIHRPSDRIKEGGKVTAVLRERMVVQGHAGADSLNLRPVEWRTQEITGRLVRWDERRIAIRVSGWQSGEDATFEIPLDQIEQVDAWPGFKPGPVLTVIASTVIVIGIAILIIWALSTPEDSI